MYVEFLWNCSGVVVFAFFINPIGASAINPGTQNLGPIHPHHPSSRGAFTLTSVVSSTGPALPNWILPETPVAVAGFQRPQVNSVRDHRDGTSSSRRESSTGIDCETHCQPVPIRVRKQTSKLTITQATRLLDAEVHELRGKITGFDPTWAGRSHGQGLNQRGDKARAIGPGRYGMGVISNGINGYNRALTNTANFTCPLVL